jgi:hypothetical protein
MKLGLSLRLILSVATIYTEIIRVFLEFIDNALDEAEDFFDPKTNAYKKPINIEVTFRGRTIDDFEVEIKDNCKGIQEFEKLVKSIGNSQKKDKPQLNGQFGFGMFSFVAVCCKMIIKSSTNGYESKQVEICRDIFEKDNKDEMDLSISTQNTSLFRLVQRARLLPIGTSITLREFDRHKYKQINIGALVKEIEKHFETILRRGNLKITVESPDGSISECKPFDYDRYEGDVYYNKLTKLEYISVKRTAEKSFIDISNNPVTIFLKIVNDKAIDRRPFFVINGRRITEISDVKAFRTNSKSMIWSHPNITGYIDVTGCLEPTIARNEFRDNRHKKALFNSLLNEELKIKSFVEESLKVNLNSKYKKLESILENTLNEVAKELSTAKKKNNKSGKNLDYIRNDNKDNFQAFTLEDRTFENKIKTEPLFTRENQINTEGDSKKRFTNVFLPSINTSKNEQKEKNGFGFNIRLDCDNEPLKDNGGNKVRSILNGNEIVIYQKHPEFESRLDNSRDGIPRLSLNLIYYLCSEIMIHFKLLEYLKNNQPEDTKEILSDFTISMYSFQKRLTGLEGKKLSDFN